MENKKTLPNSTATLILGICSIVFGCLFVGFILGIIGLSISGTSKRLYLQNPNDYQGYGALNAGRIMSIIGLILGSIAILYWLIVVVIIGAGTLPWLQFLSN
ncbi:MAG: CCC motif membrane protein [Bacteroidales bacterium]|nr:CCC motif membrane protein [Bacteroidales bacterium]